MDNRDYLNQLMEQLRNGSVNQSRLALNELAKMPSEQAVPVLQELTQAQNFQTRRLAVMGLGNHRTEASFQVLEAVLAQEQDGNVLAEAANSLFEFGDVSIPLLQTLFFQQSHWLTRQTVLSILMEADYPEVLLTIIREGLQDNVQTVKETAILALGPLMNGPFENQALELLIELASATNWRDRWRTATTLSLSTSSVGKQLLANLCQDDNHYVVAAALEAKVMNGKQS
ncbi:MAG: HEAT repeat domain-containing protein [Leptolyngbya sp. SIO1D8]|nr:HEAT repeat domain-containing protein [Leptolyngbya sp. SIO1D8]